MAVASGSLRSTLNPNAPLFIPAAFQQVEDFSPEWWDLVKTSAWFREHWLNQHQELERAEEDVANLLPDTFDLGFQDDMASFEDLDDAVFRNAFVAVEEPAYVQKRGRPQPVNTEAVLRSLSMVSPRTNVSRALLDSPKLMREKPNPMVSPKPSPRRIIQQPR